MMKHKCHVILFHTVYWVHYTVKNLLYSAFYLHSLHKSSEDICVCYGWQVTNHLHADIDRKLVNHVCYYLGLGVIGVSGNFIRRVSCLKKVYARVKACLEPSVRNFTQ